MVKFHLKAAEDCQSLGFCIVEVILFHVFDIVCNPYFIFIIFTILVKIKWISNGEKNNGINQSILLWIWINEIDNSLFAYKLN